MRSLLVVAMAVIVTGLSCSPRVNTSRETLERNKLIHQLVRVTGDLEQATLDLINEGKESGISNAVLRVIEIKGRDVLRAEGQSNIWLKINPDSAKWANPSQHAQDIAVFNPSRLYDSTNRVSVFFGATFAGNFIQMTNLPPWEGIAVPEAERRDTQ